MRNVPRALGTTERVSLTSRFISANAPNTNPRRKKRDRDDAAFLFFFFLLSFVFFSNRDFFARKVPRENNARITESNDSKDSCSERDRFFMRLAASETRLAFDLTSVRFSRKTSIIQLSIVFKNWNRYCKPFSSLGFESLRAGGYFASPSSR